MNKTYKNKMKATEPLEMNEIIKPGRRLQPVFGQEPTGGARPAAEEQAENPLMNRTMKKSQGTGIRARVRGRIQSFFYFAPEAGSVRLAGDFTDWRERPVELRRGPNGRWWTAVRLEAGTHYYRFLVDGQWRDDPDCPLVVPNPFGTMNAVRQVY